MKKVHEISSLHDCVPGIPDPHISEVFARVVLHAPYIVDWQGTTGSRYIAKMINIPNNIRIIIGLYTVFF